MVSVGLRTRTLKRPNRLAAVMSCAASLGALNALWQHLGGCADLAVTYHGRGGVAMPGGRQAHELMSKGKP
jgi:hypothetical protein